MDDLELQRLEAVADAARAVRVLREGAAEYDEVRQAVRWLDVTLDILDKGREVPEMEYDNGPWASTGSDSYVDVARYWRFENPQVTDTNEVNEPETKPPIRIVPLKQGYLVVPNVFEGYADDDLAFTDALDAAEWLLEWLGFENVVAASAVDILAELGPDELWDRGRQQREADYHWVARDDHCKALDVAEAAQAFVEYTHPPTFDALREAVKKWRGIEEK